MLVLGRVADESIVIRVPPSDVQRVVRITVCNVRNNHAVRIGVDADKDILVLRSELEEHK